MLARYSPDIWRRAIDKQVHVAEVADTLLKVDYRKFPNLILNQLTSTHYELHVA
jgi:hypothetical protein